MSDLKLCMFNVRSYVMHVYCQILCYICLMSDLKLYMFICQILSYICLMSDLMLYMFNIRS